MASYFDLPPQKKAAAASIEEMPENERRHLGKMSLLSPAVTQLLDDLGDERSNSSSEEASLSEEGDLTGNINKQHESRDKRQDKQEQCPRTPVIPSSLSPRRDKPKSSPSKGSGHVKISPARAGGGGAVKQKHPHMARFHSLRSMLFSANLEDKMMTATEADCQREQSAAQQWKAQHEQRQMHRPKTPEKDAPEKDGLGTRIKTRIRRMTSKEGPAMGSIQEGKVSDFDDYGSTASSDGEVEEQPMLWKHRDGDEESIHHSDVEDLVRWVSRRDPPSDGEIRKNKSVEDNKEDSGHESLGHSDVEDLVRYVSRRSEIKKDEPTGYSDASTESDSEMLKHSSEEEDAEDLVRWISHREGANAGPVRNTTKTPDLPPAAEKHRDSDLPELVQPSTRHGHTSSDSAAGASERETVDFSDEPERGRPRSRPESPIVPHKTHLRHDDVDELVRWVSKKDLTPQDTVIVESDNRNGELKKEEDVKKQKISIHDDPRSLSHADIQDLVEHARKQSGGDPSGSTRAKPDGPETGDLRTLRTAQPEVAQIRHKEDEKKQQLGMTADDGSLSHSDVQGLIQHIKSKEPLDQPLLDTQNSKTPNLPIDTPEDDSIGETKNEGKRSNNDRADSLGDEDVDELIGWISKKSS